MMVDLEEGIQAWIESLKVALKDIPETKTLEGHREYHERRATASPFPVPDSVEVRDRWITAPGRLIPLRLYRPKGTEDRNLPIVLYFHGGGFIAGSVSTHDLYGYGLAESTGALVVSVNYRLAPENPFPSAPDDCYYALCWLKEHAGLIKGDASRIAVGGDSAGGALTASVALLARDRNGPEIRFTFFLCAALDCNLEAYEQIDNQDPFSPKERFRFFWENYLQGKLDTTDPLAVPMRVRNPRGLPPALIVTPEHHLLKDEGVRYGELLKSGGVPTEIRVVPRTMHTFLRARFMSELAEAEFQYLCRAICNGLDTPRS